MASQKLDQTTRSYLHNIGDLLNSASTKVRVIQSKMEDYHIRLPGEIMADLQEMFDRIQKAVEEIKKLQKHTQS